MSYFSIKFYVCYSFSNFFFTKFSHILFCFKLLQHNSFLETKKKLGILELFQCISHFDQKVQYNKIKLFIKTYTNSSRECQVLDWKTHRAECYLCEDYLQSPKRIKVLHNKESLTVLLCEQLSGKLLFKTSVGFCIQA